LRLVRKRHCVHLIVCRKETNRVTFPWKFAAITLIAWQLVPNVSILPDGLRASCWLVLLYWHDCLSIWSELLMCCWRCSWILLMRFANVLI